MFGVARRLACSARPISARRLYNSQSQPHVYFFPTSDTKAGHVAAVTYTPETPGPHSASIMGWAPLNALGNDIDLSLPDRFQENPGFIAQVHKVLSSAVVDDPDLQALAAYSKTGYMHVADQRNPPPFGRIPIPEDIIGSVLVKDGAMVPGTYAPMDSAYRLVTPDGIMRLDEYLHRRLVEHIKAQ